MRVRIFIAACLAVCVGAASADDAVDEANFARPAVERALAYINGEGAGLEKGSCVNCHHAAQRTWAMGDAAKFGVDLDLKSLKDSIAQDLEPLVKAKTDHAGKPWWHSLASFYLLGHADDQWRLFPDGMVDELKQVLVSEQSVGGFWTAAPQYANQRRPRHDADEVQTIWSVLALSRFSDTAAVGARDKGLSWLKTIEPGTTIDSRALRLIVERHWGTPEKYDLLLMEFLGTQRTDGGWGWQSDDESDAWATGIALYVLDELSPPSAADGLVNAQQFLVRTQRTDGSWLVPGKLTNHTDISSYFGTVWAVIGLSRTAKP